MLTLDELRDDESIDTVIMAFTDMQGRLLGKRLHRDFFLEQVDHGHGTEGCNYLLALDMEMDPVPGYEIASLGARLRRLRARARPRDAAAHPVARGDGAGAVRRRVGRRLAGAAVAAPGAARAARAGERRTASR